MKSLKEKQRLLLTQLQQCKNMVRGSINAICSTCKKARCKCTLRSGKKVYRLTYKDQHQKTQIVYIPKHRLAEIKKMLSNYAKSRTLIRRLINTNIEIFKKRPPP